VEAPIYRTNYLLRGVALPAGERRVEMLYAIPKTSLGLVISLCSLLLIGGLAIYAGRPTYGI
jgi:hypothetical protein